jgi:pimeloyl-ACP methyl ester carboxylesterase
MQHKLFLYKHSEISYYRFGSGVKPAICLHGYGEDATTFGFLERYAGAEYCFYSIDLPFHGQTKWNEGLLFTLKDLQQIIEAILIQDNIELEKINHKLTLLGFSLGGRIALSLYEAIPEQIKKLLLLAPDGLKVNFWYWLTTQTWLGNKLFSFTMKHPGWFFMFLKLINKLGLVNASIFKFVNQSIGDKEVRMQLYNRWTSLRKLKPGIKRIKSFVRQHKTPVHLIYGKHDRIILPVRGERFRKRIEDYCSLQVIHSGHQVLHEKHIEEILPALLTKPGND